MKTIILVDDDVTNTTLLKMLLEMEGYQTFSCKSLEEARSAASKKADAFIVDCHLARGANGLTLLREIRAGETAVPPHTVVIMASGDHRLKAESLASGANRFMLKPYSPNTLVTELSHLLSEREHSG